METRKLHRDTCNLQFESTSGQFLVDRLAIVSASAFVKSSRSGQNTDALRLGRLGLLAVENSWSKFQTHVCVSAGVRAVMDQQQLYRSSQED